jgi:Protein of unknown function (DUF3617)
MLRKYAMASLVVACVAPIAWAGPMDFKGKMKEGLYEITTSMEMSGMPGMPGGMQGMKMPAMTVQHCVTKKDVEEGSQKMFGQKGPRGGEMPKDCEMKDFKMDGNTASYKMICTGEHKMDMDTSITFGGDGYKGTTKMKMDQGGQAMNMTSTFESKYKGACKS